MLVRIVFPQRMLFKYDAELPVAFALLFGYALLMIGVTTWVSIANEVKQTTTLFVTALYSVTQVINPLLPVSLLAGRSVAMTRLHRLGVNCVDPQRIAGKTRRVLRQDGHPHAGGARLCGLRARRRTRRRRRRRHRAGRRRAVRSIRWRCP